MVTIKQTIIFNSKTSFVPGSPNIPVNSIILQQPLHNIPLFKKAPRAAWNQDFNKTFLRIGTETWSLWLTLLHTAAELANFADSSVALRLYHRGKGISTVTSTLSEPQQQTAEEFGLFYICREPNKDIRRWIRPRLFPAGSIWGCVTSLDKCSFWTKHTPEGTFQNKNGICWWQRDPFSGRLRVST